MNKAKKNVGVAQANLQDIVVPIKGVTSLLTNKVSDFSLENIRRKDDGEVKLPDERTEDERMEDALYVADPDAPETEGKYGVPAVAFRKAMVSVCRNKAASGGINMASALQMFQVLGDVVPIHCRLLRKRVDAGRNGVNKALVRVVRPEFVDWSAELTIRYAADVISAEQVLNLVQQAGFSLGVGAWRPEKSGNFGMFQIKTQ